MMMRVPELAHEAIKIIQERYSSHDQPLTLGDALILLIEQADEELLTTAQRTLRIKEQLRNERRGEA